MLSRTLLPPLAPASDPAMDAVVLLTRTFFAGRGDDVLLLLEQVKPAFKAGAYVSSPKGGKGSSNIAYWTKHRAQACPLP